MSRPGSVLFLALLFPLIGCPGAEEPSTGPTRLIEGRVVADHSGEPISGARVRCGEKTVVTDPAGLFALRLPRSSESGHLDTLRAEANGFGRSRSLAARDEPMEIRLKAAFTVEATVVDRAGRPLPGVIARVHGAIESQRPCFSARFERGAVSGGDGRIRVEGISREVMAQTLTLSAARFGTRHVAVQVFEDINHVSVDLGRISLGPAHTLRLTVLGADGQPVPGTRVSMRGRFGTSVTTSEDGVAVFGRLSPGRYHLVAQPPATIRMSALVEVTDLEAVTEATVGPPSGSSLTLAVRDMAGAPIAGAGVFVSGISSLPATGPDGRITIHGLPHRRIRLTVMSPRGGGYCESRIGPVVPADQELVVILRKKATAAGVVRRPDGSPVRDARIRVMAPDGETVAGGRTGPDGRFSIGVPSGVPLRFSATTRPPASERSKGPIPTPNAHGVLDGVGAPAGHLLITLRPLPVDRTLSVRVLGPDGAPVVGAEVALNGTIGRPLTDADGKKGFAELTAWKVEVTARFGRVGVAAVPPAPVEVIPANQVVELRFRAAKLLRCRVTLPDGAPAIGAEIELVTADGARVYARSNRDGRFELAMLPGQPHALSVHCETEDRIPYQAFLEGLVPGDGELDLTLELE